MVGVKENIFLAEHEPAMRKHLGEPTIYNQVITVGLSVLYSNLGLAELITAAAIWCALCKMSRTGHIFNRNCPRGITPMSAASTLSLCETYL